MNACKETMQCLQENNEMSTKETMQYLQENSEMSTKQNVNITKCLPCINIWKEPCNLY